MCQTCALTLLVVLCSSVVHIYMSTSALCAKLNTNVCVWEWNINLLFAIFAQIQVFFFHSHTVPTSANVLQEARITSAFMLTMHYCIIKHITEIMLLCILQCIVRQLLPFRLYILWQHLPAVYIISHKELEWTMRNWEKLEASRGNMKKKLS